MTSSGYFRNWRWSLTELHSEDTDRWQHHPALKKGNKGLTIQESLPSQTGSLQLLSTRNWLKVHTIQHITFFERGSGVHVPLFPPQNTGQPEPGGLPPGIAEPGITLTWLSAGAAAAAAMSCEPLGQGLEIQWWGWIMRPALWRHRRRLPLWEKSTGCCESRWYLIQISADQGEKSHEAVDTQTAT